MPRSQGWLVITHLRDSKLWSTSQMHTVSFHPGTVKRSCVWSRSLCLHSEIFTDVTLILTYNIPIFSRIMFSVCFKNMCILLFIFLVNTFHPSVSHSKKKKILKQDKLISGRDNSAFALSTPKKWDLQKRLPSNFNIFKGTTVFLCL